MQVPPTIKDYDAPPQAMVWLYRDDNGNWSCQCQINVGDGTISMWTPTYDNMLEALTKGIETVSSCM